MLGHKTSVSKFKKIALASLAHRPEGCGFDSRSVALMYLGCRFGPHPV